MRKNILLIDDDGMITQTIGNLLKREGYTVIACNSGNDAISKVKTQEFSLIVSDIKMPDMDGLETIRNINKYIKKEGKNINVIFITGFADTQSHKEAESLGKVIYKPFDIKEFLFLVKESVNNT